MNKKTYTTHKSINEINGFFFLIFKLCRSKFPSLPKLETLSISYMSNLKEIGDGAFHGLSALRHFDCRHNIHLHSIHAHAFAKPGNESKTRVEWPPIQTVSNDYFSFSFSFINLYFHTISIR